MLITNAGHGHPEIVAAVRAVVDRPLLATYVFAHEDRADADPHAPRALARPRAATRSSCSARAARPRENCIKLSKTYALEKHGPRKKYIVTFENAFHGRTMGAQLAGGMRAAETLDGGPRPDASSRCRSPTATRTRTRRSTCSWPRSADQGVAPDEIAGVMSETYQGVGPDFLPVEYAQKLEAFCREHDIVLTMDEVQAGFGRTGRMFGFEHYGITARPDRLRQGHLLLAAACRR